MTEASKLRVPTLAVPVQLAIVGRPAAPVELFVADVVRVGRSQLLDDLAALLDAAPRFVPVRGARGVALLAKHAIAWIAITRREQPFVEDEFEDVPSEVMTLYDRVHRVEVALATGEAIVGSLLDSSPADRPRTIDHLNRAGRFVRLWTSELHYLVNGKQIVEVRELPT